MEDSRPTENMTTLIDDRNDHLFFSTNWTDVIRVSLGQHHKYVFPFNKIIRIVCGKEVVLVSIRLQNKPMVGLDMLGSTEVRALVSSPFDRPFLEMDKVQVIYIVTIVMFER
jgi:hypothetical protein